jgi:hypothetical protein
LNLGLTLGETGVNLVKMHQACQFFLYYNVPENDKIKSIAAVDAFTFVVIVDVSMLPETSSVVHL